MLIIQTSTKIKKIESSYSVSKVQKTEVNQYVTQEIQVENNQQCPAQADTIVQKTKCHQAKCADMRPEKSKHCAVRHRTGAQRRTKNVMLPHKPEIKLKKPGQPTYKQVLQNKNCSNNNIANMQLQKPSLNQENMKKPATKPKSSLCRDRNCQSTRCFKKATKCLYTKSPEKPRCGDDKNCQSPQFMRPEKPNNAMQLNYPASNTKKGAILKKIEATQMMQPVT